MQSVNNDKHWRILNYESKYEMGVLSLFKINYPETNLWKKDFFRWQNFENPGGNSIIKLAVNSLSEVVGFYCVMPQLYWINGKKTPGSISLNTLVREDYRGMGIFTALAVACYQECVNRKIYFTLGFPNQNSYPGFISKLGFTDLGELPLLIKPLRLGNLMAYKLKINFAKTLLRPFDSLVRNHLDIIEGVGEIIKFGNWVDNLQIDENAYRVVKDRHFLNWRTKWPERDYKIYVYSRGKTKGFIVLRVMEVGGLTNGLIVDLVVDDKKSNLQIGKFLVEAANKYFQTREVDQIGSLFLRNSLGYKILRGCGYFNCPNFLKPQPMRAIVRWHIGKEPDGFKNINNWILSMLDYDVA